MNETLKVVIVNIIICFPSINLHHLLIKLFITIIIEVNGGIVLPKNLNLKSIPHSIYDIPIIFFIT